jgi:polyphosphate glucokinase
MSRTYPSGVVDAAELTVPAPIHRQLGLGIDFGGTGIKAALVDLGDGTLISSRVRMNTPKPSTPDAVAAVVKAITVTIAKEHVIPDGIPVGLGLPGVVKQGTVMTAANIDKEWIGKSAADVVGNALARRVWALNDADAAGLAEVRLGAGRGLRGVVLMLTVGTGIGSGLFVDGRLVPNTELGHIEMKGVDAETRVSASARERRGLRWKPWATEFNDYLARLEAYLWPDLIILGGGVSKVMDKYASMLKSRAPIAVAQYRNTSGIIGAAMHAADEMRDESVRTFAAQIAAAESGEPAAARDTAAVSAAAGVGGGTPSSPATTD